MKAEKNAKKDRRGGDPYERVAIGRGEAGTDVEVGRHRIGAFAPTAILTGARVERQNVSGQKKDRASPKMPGPFLEYQELRAVFADATARRGSGHAHAEKKRRREF